MIEHWKDISEYVGFYQISDAGRIRSVDRLVLGRGMKLRPRLGRILRPGIARYPIVYLWKEGVGTKIYVHHLVWRAFRGPIPRGLQINHKDLNKKNNHISNLEVVTPKQNKRHAMSHGLTPQGEHNPNAKLTNQQVLEIRSLHASGTPCPQIARQFGLDGCHVRSIVRRRTWGHL